MDRPAVRDAALLIVRVVIGVVFVAHGYDKFFLTGLTETTGQFSAWGVPQPGISAIVAGLSEMIGGALLVVGLLSTVVAGALALMMVAAVYFVHLDAGFFVAQGGGEYAAVLMVTLLVIVVFGAGRASLDRVLASA
ncbi:DoxX family protein [Corynebacterium uterequi]|uniref:Putative membrane protein n=1 Tax=Corynebacterium uterequi TaxID=1072256 RepID=A0A0G3HBQ4_9CORY|nr:DoxX family protein [Corynebacterium uterequi]AKK10709.1 putative membrane protein [Corynebacterium uterequi]